MTSQPVFYEAPNNCQVPDLGRKWEALFGRRSHGYFVEVGAYDGHNFSNTSCLADAGWSGLYIEPIEEFAEKCRLRHANNPGVAILTLAASDRAGEAEIFVGDTLTTLVSEQVADYERIDWAKGLHRGESRRIRTECLDTILDCAGAPAGFDLLVVDVEGAEDRVMQGFDIARWQPKAMLIEIEDEHPDFRGNPRVVQAASAIRGRLELAGYELLFKDQINSIYVRADVMREAESRALQGENAVPSLLDPEPAEAAERSTAAKAAMSWAPIKTVLEGLEARSTPDLGRAQGFNAQARDHWVEAKAASVEPGSKVLDVGAGTAPYRHLFGHCDYQTHDFAQYEGYQNGWEGDYAHIDYVSDILDIPVADGSFDVILCTEVLEHVPRPVEALAEMARILRPGGRLLITAPLGSGLHQQPHHYYGGYTPHWYRKFLTEFGCDVVEITPNHGWFALLAQECARFSWSFDKHKHLHGDDGPHLSILLGDTLARYLYAQDERVFIPEFTVGYHVEAKRLTEHPIVSQGPDNDLLRRPDNRVESREARKERFFQEFRDAHYVRHNQRRQEHLASLGLPIQGRSVLELGAGIGDHTTFFIDRNCSICVSDGRPELYDIIKDRYHWMRTELIDLEAENQGFNDVYDIVYAYGLLYHLNDPARALASMARWCGGLLLLETCVSPRDDISINPASEVKDYGSQAVSGMGCRPSRPWIFAELKRHFSHVYCTATQPWHPEFPLDWDAIPPDAGLTRAVFVASRTPLDLPSLLPSLPSRQVRH